MKRLALALGLLLAAGVAAQDPAASPTAPVAPTADPQAAFPLARIETTKGTIVIRLRPDLAPRHVKAFLATAKARGYDRTTFHRVIKNAIVQGGDPLSAKKGFESRYGTTGLGTMKPEITPTPFARGVVAAVLKPGAPASAGQQFFICLYPQPTLQGQFTIFGEVVAGLEIADAISLVAADGDRATERIEMKVTIEEPAAAS
ncbi:MAG: peptidylprolyl isomerase [Vicinamibacteria bacterium]|nr:peptidylprolyl isomerase [Vicinamibacteria bacterium]